MENQKGFVGVESLFLTDLISAFIILGFSSLAFLVFLIKHILHMALSHMGEPAPITP